MPPTVRRAALLPAVLACAAAAGCLGGTQNPSYFPFYLPTGDIIRTHAKPGGFGYFANFDSKACKLEVVPTSKTNPTRTQQVLIATVYDRDGDARRSRRVEWMIEGPGNIIEVDESGYLPGRGYKVDNKYAVGYTDYFRHTVTRGNDDPRDDFEIRPGQTWCVVSSAVEGQTKVTVYAPEVYDWDTGRVFVTLDWQDAPFAAGPGVSRSGAGLASGGRQPPGGADQQGADASRSPRISLDVKLPSAVPLNREVPVTIALANAGRADGEPLTVKSEVPAGTEFVRADPAPTRRTGAALVWSLDGVPGGQSRAITLVLRPVRRGAFTVAAAAETADGLAAETKATATADAAGLTVAVDAPGYAAAGEQVPVRVKVTNTGAVPVENAVAWVDALGHAPTEQPVGRVPPGETKTVTVPLAAEKAGRFPVRVNVTADGGLAQRAEAEVTVSRTELAATVTGPEAVGVGEEAIFDVTVSNPGDVPVKNLAVRAAVPRGLTPKSAGETGKVTADGAAWAVGTLAAGAKTTVRLVATGDRATADRETIRVTAAGDLPGGGRLPEVAASAPVAVAGRPVLVLELATPSGPVPVGGRAVYRATVRNRGTGSARGVEVSADLSPELSPVRGTGPGGAAGRSGDQRLTFGTIDELRPGSAAVFTVEAEAAKPGDARVTAVVSSRDLPTPLREEQPTRVTGRR